MGNGWLMCYNDEGVSEVYGAMYDLEEVCFINLQTGEMKEKENIDCILIAEKGQPSVYGKYTENGWIWGYLSSCGDEVLAMQYESARCFSEECAVVRFKGDEGESYIDIQGKKLFDRTFAEAMPFSEGLAAVSLDGEKYGYIDKTGEFVIPPIYDRWAIDNLMWEVTETPEELMQFHNGYAMVANAEEGWAAYIDKTGKEVFRFSVPVSTEE